MIDYWKVIIDEGEILHCEVSIKYEIKTVQFYFNSTFKFYTTQKNLVYVQIPCGATKQSAQLTDFNKTWSNKVREGVMIIDKIKGKFHLRFQFKVGNRGNGVIVSWIHGKYGTAYREAGLVSYDLSPSPVNL